MIDYLTNRIAAEDETKKLIRARNVSSNLDGIKANRGKFLNSVGGDISRITGNAPTYGEFTPQLDRKLEDSLAKQKRSDSTQTNDLLFQQLLQQAQEAGMDLRSAYEYARQVADQRTQIGYAENEANKSRMFTNKMHRTRNNYEDLNTNLQLSEQDDYGGALMRVLLGTGMSIGTSYALNKSLAGKVGGSSIPNGSYASRMNSAFQGQDNQNYMKKYVSDYGARGYGGQF